ncbi:hypothetical protein HKX48_007798 [Thoreauomyces humboldtii]|nr:hypothetical protein HKX48_007798 [Thoreauomyces humboldtii]
MPVDSEITVVRDAPSPAPESEAGSDLPVYSTNGFFSFLESWRPAGESRSSRRNKGKGPQVGAPLPINPKGLFANERTFLSWMNLCVTIGGLAVGLLNFGDTVGQMAGLVFGLIAIALMFYALMQFWARAERLQAREKGINFEDMTGAFALVSIIFLAVGINLGLRFIVPSKA